MSAWKLVEALLSKSLGGVALVAISAIANTVAASGVACSDYELRIETVNGSWSPTATDIDLIELNSVKDGVGVLRVVFSKIGKQEFSALIAGAYGTISSIYFGDQLQLEAQILTGGAPPGFNLPNVSENYVNALKDCMLQ